MSENRSPRRRTFWILGAALLLLLAAVAAIPFIVDANRFRPELEAILTDSLGREVRIGNLRFSLLSGGITADDIKIADDPKFSRTPFVSAGSLTVGVELKPLIFSRTVSITDIHLEKPAINLIRSSSGDWNFSSFGKKSSNDPGDGPGDPPVGEVSVKELRITDGRLTVLRQGGDPKRRVYDRVEIRAQGLSFTSTFPFTLTATLPGGGDVKVDGRAGPANRQDVSLTPVDVNVAVKQFDMLNSGLIGPESGLAGVIDFTGSLNSDGKVIRNKGRAKADKFKFVKGGATATLPLLVEYTLSHDIRKQSGTLIGARGNFGRATARFSGSYDASGESTILRLKMRGDDMPAEDMQALLPAIGVTLPKGTTLQGGTLNADLTTEGPIERLVTSGSVGILNTRLVGFDLGTKLSAVASLAGISPKDATDIERFSSDLRLTPDGIQSTNLLLVATSIGQLTGNGKVGSDSSLDFRMLATLSSSRGVVGELGRLAGGKPGSAVRVPFFIRGMTSDPSFVPDVKGTAQELIESAISRKEGSAGDKDAGKALSDALQQLFRKKKQR